MVLFAPRRDTGKYKGIDNAFTMDTKDVLQILDANVETGLYSTEVKRRLRRDGLNVIKTKKPPFWEIYIAPFLDTLITIYIIMISILLLLSIIATEIRATVFWWLTFIGFNMLIAIWQQFRAQKKLDALQKLSPPRAKVIREGLRIEILAQNLVIGDIIELELGDRVPADARLLYTNEFYVNESSLTGESQPRRKYRDTTRGLEESLALSERGNMVYLGTFVQTGTATAVVVATGNDTEIGKIADSMSGMMTMEIPLRTRINKMGRRLGIAMMIVLIISIIIRLVLLINSQELSFANIVIVLSRSIINAMAVIPLNIPLVTTLTLVTGVLNLARKKVIVKNLAVVETLGRTTVLCSDKTGTITTSKMSVVKIWDNQQFYEVETKKAPGLYVRSNGDGYKLDNVSFESTLGKMIISGILNNDARIMEVATKQELDAEDVENEESYSLLDTDRFKAVGNSTDVALLMLAARSQINLAKISTQFKRIQSYPFSSVLKRMSGIFSDKENGNNFVFSKGAPEIVLGVSVSIYEDNMVVPLDAEKRREIIKQINLYSRQGYRLLSMAFKEVDSDYLEKLDQEMEERDQVESDLIYLGFVCILDPPREGVIEAVNRLDQAGIFPIMITGDAPTTAGTIAQQVAILDPDEIVIEGNQIPDLSTEDFFKVSVFARVTPQDKKIIIDKYQARGDVVAMTGDGVNDGLAIQRADAGVSMGITGTDVAKEAADLIIADDSYVSLVNGVEEGRNLYEKIRGIIFFYLAVNISEAFIYFSTFMIMDYFINDSQRLFVAFIAHGIPAFAIILGQNDKNIMKLKPRRDDTILSLRMVGGMLIYSFSLLAVIGFAYFGVYNELWDPLAVTEFNKGGWQPNFDTDPSDPESWEHAKARTLFITVVFLAETALVLGVFRFNESAWVAMKKLNRIEWTFILTPLVLLFTIMYIPTVQEFTSMYFTLELIRLSILDLVHALVLGFSPLMLFELYKGINRLFKKQL